jgi:IS30 family transposase
LKLTYPDSPEMLVSHESIYRTLYVQSRGALRKELSRCEEQVDGWAVTTPDGWTQEPTERRRPYPPGPRPDLCTP